LRRGFEAKAAEFSDVLKIGRTQLQDAVPMTLGQEFSTYGVMIEEDEARLREARALIQEINLGRHRHRHRHQCARRLCRDGLQVPRGRKRSSRW
jgi:hypothetical protein